MNSNWKPSDSNLWADEARVGLRFAVFWITSLFLSAFAVDGKAADRVALDKSGTASADLFRTRVAPIFERSCINCHNSDDHKGKLSLQTAEEFNRGGESGAIFTAGKPDKSLLIDYIGGAKPEMPKDARPLKADDVAAIRQWIATGAVWPAGMTLRNRREIDANWWSLLPIVRPELPRLTASDEGWCRTPIDRFILASLRKQKLAPSPEADRRTLIRRLCFDLTGLPPSPDDVTSFASDSDPRGYERLVDRLLASPRYGERWARHWLDVAHYADTHGFDKDKLRPNAWPYRDYVIRSFNVDKPYSQFVSEQLAGDALYPDSPDGIAALGFIAAGPFDYVGQVEVAEATTDGQICRMLDRDDMVRTTMETFTSTTVGCARCHDHKFDPIKQNDYYSLQAVFAGVDRANRAYDPLPETVRKRALLTAEKKKLSDELAEIVYRQYAAAGDASTKLDAKTRTELKEFDAQLAEVTRKLAALPPMQMVFAATSHFAKEGHHLPTDGKPRDIYVLHRGDIHSPGEKVCPGAIASIAALQGRFTATGGDESQRRAALAAWITDRKNPLTWRSLVNRVWHYHFGRGIVDTPNDFGRMGSRPTHPELLDWLALWFRDDAAQSLKALHRMIVLSAAYRQSSSPPGLSPNNDATASPTRVDAGNRLLWRMNRTKLEAEEVRDAVLSVAGKLDLQMGGPGFMVFGLKDDHSPHYLYDEFDPDDARSHRRTIYRFIVRSMPDPFLETLDCADPCAIVERRNETLTALQALALLNNKFMIRMSEHFAARVEANVPKQAGWPEKVDVSIRLALGRGASPNERDVLAALASRRGLPTACRVIFNMNEFVFLD